MDIVSLLILRALSGGGGGEIPVASQINYDNSTSGLDAENVQNALDELSSEKLNTSEKGSAGGVAELNENGIILTSQLPSFVDDVLEFPTLNDFPAQGESGKIYVDLSTNRTYRWGGSGYTEISPSLALGETSSTAYRGDRGKTAYDHSQLKTGNPHNVTKAQIGLGNVDNTSDVNKPISTATQAALDTKLSEDDLYNMIEDSTVSGNPVTLKALAKTSAKSATVTMLPIQDLHGQDAPYPAGGGKNKFHNTAETATIQGITFIVNSDGTITVQNNATGTAVFYVAEVSLPNGDYIFNGCPSGGGSNTYKLDISKGGTFYTDNGSGVSFTVTDQNPYLVRLVVYSGNGNGKVFKPMVRLATVTDDSFAPYSNICPISGRDSVDLTRTGVNQWDEEWEVGDIDATTGENSPSNSVIRTKNYIHISPETEYFAYIGGDYGYTLRTRFYDINKRYIGTNGYDGPVKYNLPFKTPSNAYYMRFTPQSSYGTTYNNDISINYPATDTDYHAYDGQTHTTAFPSTVYGGEYEFVDAPLKSTYGIVDFGDLNWFYDSNYSVFTANYTNVKFIPGTITCIASCYKVADRQASTAADMSIYTRQSGGNAGFGVKDSGFTDATSFKTARTGQKIVYELATPTETTLTPQSISLNKGDNVITTDGDNTEIVYTELDLTELPDVTSADEGKVLTVNSSGEWVAQTLPDGTNISY